MSNKSDSPSEPGNPEDYFESERVTISVESLDLLFWASLSEEDFDLSNSSPRAKTLTVEEENWSEILEKACAGGLESGTGNSEPSHAENAKKHTAKFTVISDATDEDMKKWAKRSGPSLSCLTAHHDIQLSRHRRATENLAATVAAFFEKWTEAERKDAWRVFLLGRFLERQRWYRFCMKNTPDLLKAKQFNRKRAPGGPKQTRQKRVVGNEECHRQFESWMLNIRDKTDSFPTPKQVEKWLRALPTEPTKATPPFQFYRKGDTLWCRHDSGQKQHGLALSTLKGRIRLDIEKRHT